MSLLRWFSLAAVALLCGCGPFCWGLPCPSCPALIRVRITHGAVTNLSATIPARQLTATCTETECTFLEGEGPGDFEVVLSGDGIQTQTVTVSVPAEASAACCSCGYATGVVDVAPQRL